MKNPTKRKMTTTRLSAATRPPRPIHFLFFLSFFQGYFQGSGRRRTHSRLSSFRASSITHSALVFLALQRTRRRPPRRHRSLPRRPRLHHLRHGGPPSDLQPSLGPKVVHRVGHPQQRRHLGETVHPSGGRVAFSPLGLFSRTLIRAASPAASTHEVSETPATRRVKAIDHTRRIWRIWSKTPVEYMVKNKSLSTTCVVVLRSAGPDESSQCFSDALRAGAEPHPKPTAAYARWKTWMPVMTWPSGVMPWMDDMAVSKSTPRLSSSRKGFP